MTAPPPHAIPFSERISFRYARTVIWLALGLGVVFACVQITFDYTAHISAFAKTDAQVIKTVRKAAAQAVLELDPDQALEVARGLMEYSPVREVRIETEFGSELVLLRRGGGNERLDWLTEWMFGGIRAEQIPLALEIGPRKSTGEMTIRFDPTEMAGAFYRRAATVLISGLLRNLLFAIALLYFFNIALSRPLRQLVAEVQAIDPSRPGIQLLNVPRRIKGELAIVISAINGLLTAIGETARLKREAETARTIAEESDRAKSKFMSIMSHELRTPMNAILGFGQLLEDPETGALNPRQKQYVAHMLDAGRHLQDLMDQALDLTRIDIDELDLHIEPVDPAAIIDECIKLTRPLALESNIEVAHDTAGEPVKIMADAVRLRQVLLNLISNGIKYNKPDGRVGVSTSDNADGYLTIDVVDTGIGIPEDAFDGIFLPFNRYNHENAAKGAGIGLALARQLTHLMGGGISVASDVGQGSTFTVRLPLADPA